MVDPNATPKIIKTLNSQMDGSCDPTCCCTTPGGRPSQDLNNPPRNAWVGGAEETYVSPEIENERTLGQFAPVRVMQCCDCASFFLEGDAPEECPNCHSEEAEEFGKVVPVDDEEEEMTEEDLDLDLDESLDLLEAKKYSEFNRKFGRQARVRGNNFFLINEGVKSRVQRLSQSQLRAYKLSKFYGQK